jgi:hypothetical protein
MTEQSLSQTMATWKSFDLQMVRCGAPIVNHRYSRQQFQTYVRAQQQVRMAGVTRQLQQRRTLSIQRLWQKVFGNRQVMPTLEYCTLEKILR